MNWLGHRLAAEASRSDEMLLRGSHRSHLEAIRGAIDEHIWYLRVEYGLPVTRLPDGRWMFDRVELGVAND